MILHKLSLEFKKQHLFTVGRHWHGYFLLAYVKLAGCDFAVCIYTLFLNVEMLFFIFLERAVFILQPFIVKQ